MVLPVPAITASSSSHSFVQYRWLEVVRYHFSSIGSTSERGKSYRINIRSSLSMDSRMDISGLARSESHRSPRILPSTSESSNNQEIPSQFEMVQPTGLEPVTSSFAGRHSNPTELRLQNHPNLRKIRVSGLLHDSLSLLLSSIEFVDRSSFQESFLSGIEWMASRTTFHEVIVLHSAACLEWMSTWASHGNHLKSRMNIFFHKKEKRK